MELLHILYHTIGDDFETFLDPESLMSMTLVTRDGTLNNSLLQGLKQLKTFLELRVVKLEPKEIDRILTLYPLRCIPKHLGLIKLDDICPQNIHHGLFLASQLLHVRKFITNETFQLIQMEFGILKDIVPATNSWFIPQVCQRCVNHPTILETILKQHSFNHDKSYLYPITPSIMDILLQHDPKLQGSTRDFIISHKASYTKANSAFGRFLYKAIKCCDLDLLIPFLKSFNLKVPLEEITSYMKSENNHPWTIKHLIYKLNG